MRQARSAAIGVCVLAAAATQGCGGSDAPASAPIVRDSAGTTIVENVAPQWRVGEAPLLAAAPSLVIGESADFDSTQMLFRVQAVHRTTQESVVVANAGSSEIRIYGPDGVLLHSAGRSGGGPGEFGALSWLSMGPGDSLLAYDTRARRFSVFDSEAGFVRSFSPQLAAEDSRFRGPIGLLGDGSVIATRTSIGPGPPPAAGMMRDTATFVRMDRDGALGGALARMPGDERMLRGSQAAGSIEIFIPPFGKRLVAAARAERFCAAAGDVYEIACYRADGGAARLVRLAGVERPMSSEHLEAAIERRTASIPDAATRQRVAANFREAPLPERFPAVSRLLLDARGRLWAMDFLAPRDTAATWRVFDTDGRYLGVVSMPRAFTVHEIGTDYVLGVGRDENDVEQVRMYALEGGE